MFRRLVLTVSLTLLCISAMAQQGYAVSEGIVYTALDDAYAQERCRLDVYYPEGVKDAPSCFPYHEIIHRAVDSAYIAFRWCCSNSFFVNL